ncbi:hypothetical protein [Mesorhizobium sp.]|uniref:hypothetical protein n=1 Tax=Mesorhizobium sp. TaxID=1871066 RepID=UPI000FE6136E|nr:hypothetical protein [Mesorhizobium sp.]RWP80466.1 MAG: hypothetical protein EOR10_08460 [Mesorhizobium sp.]
MKTQYLAILLCVFDATVASADSSDLSTDITMPEINIYADPPDIPSYSPPSDIFPEIGLPYELPKPALKIPPPPKIALPIPSRLRLAQNKLIFFKRTSLKLEYLLGMMAVVFPQLTGIFSTASKIITTAVAAYSFLKPSDEEHSRKELMKTLDIICKDCHIAKTFIALEAYIAQVQSIVQHGESNTLGMADISMDPVLEGMVRYIGMYTIDNNCGIDIKVALHYLHLDGSWRTIGFFPVPNGKGITPHDHNMPLFSTNARYYTHVRTVDGKELVGRTDRVGALDFEVKGKLYNFAVIPALRDEFGDWTVAPCG